MQHLPTLFSFLLTTRIISITAFPLISVGSRIDAVPPSYKHLTLKRSF